MRRRAGIPAVLLTAALVLATAGLVAAQPSGREGLTTPLFRFGIIGDAPYDPAQEVEFERMIREMNRERLAFVLHVGDIQGGRTPCTDEVLHRNLAWFNTFAAPLVYTPGDNEWTDCHRTGGDPLERLARIRQVFFATNESQGSRTLLLARQSTAYPENSRFSYGGVTVLSIHAVGSNNNLPETPGGPGDPAEFAARDAANLEWLRAGFATARSEGSRGVVVFMQANPGFELPTEDRTGFNDLLAAMEREVAASSLPAVLAHGDTHYVRVDKPLASSSTRRRVQHFTRVETYGSPDVHWVRASVDPRRGELFEFSAEVVEGNS